MVDDEVRRAAEEVGQADRLTRLDLSTIVVGAKGERTLVVDASLGTGSRVSTR